ncbi:hypothetical protein D3C86_2087250 [compost metagenome]
MRNWPSTPIVTSNGLFTTSLKSSTESVSPIPNMMIDRSVTIHGAICLNVSGKKKPSTANRMTQAAKVLPTKAETAASVFISILPR